MAAMVLDFHCNYLLTSEVLVLIKHIFKIAKNIEKRGRMRGIERVIKGANMIKVHCMHLWKHHNEMFHTIQLIQTKKEKSLLRTKLK
jgi:hypothetical protein